ncbi:hypothetical protein D3C80_1915170 [compost metagenome]
MARGLLVQLLLGRKFKRLADSLAVAVNNNMTIFVNQKDAPSVLIVVALEHAVYFLQIEVGNDRADDLAAKAFDLHSYRQGGTSISGNVRA